MNPTGKPYRFAVLLCASLMAFGSYFAYDSVGAIETTLIKVFHTDRSAIGAMYSVYSVAAVFALLFCGYLVDRIGTGRASLLSSALLAIGAAMAPVAASLPSL